MSQPKQHHYVHSSYLQNFGDEGQSLQIFDKWGKGRHFNAPPDKILRQGYYYSQPVHSEGQFDIGLETFFSKVESDWPSIVESISSRQQLIEETYMRFCETIYMLRARVPNTRKALEVCLQDTARKLMLENDEPVPEDVAHRFSINNSRIERLRLEGSLRFFHLVEEELIVASIDPHRSIHFMPQIVRSMEPYVGRFFQKSFLHNKTEIDFITSDNPIVFFNRSNDSVIKPFCQDADGGFEFIFPITRRIAFYHNTKERIDEVHRVVRSSKTIRKINSLIAQFADRFVLGSSANEVGLGENFLNVCPIPDPTQSVVLPERIIGLNYKFGAPLVLPKWKYDFEE